MGNNDHDGQHRSRPVVPPMTFPCSLLSRLQQQQTERHAPLAVYLFDRGRGHRSNHKTQTRHTHKQHKQNRQNTLASSSVHSFSPRLNSCCSTPNVSIHLNAMLCHAMPSLSHRFTQWTRPLTSLASRRAFTFIRIRINICMRIPISHTHLP